MAARSHDSRERRYAHGDLFRSRFLSEGNREGGGAGGDEEGVEEGGGEGVSTRIACVLNVYL